MQAQDVMTTDVASVAHDADLDDVARLLLERRISAVPVVDTAGRLIGIVSEGDLIRGHGRSKPGKRQRWLRALFRDPDKRAGEVVDTRGRTAKDVMTHDVFAVAPDTPLREVAHILERFRVKRVPVIEEGRVVGIVSRADLLRGMAAHDPEAPAAPGDRDLRARVRDALRKAGLPPGTVTVVVSGGVVHLWGAVASESERESALRAAEGAVPERAVENHVAVQPGDDGDARD